MSTKRRSVAPFVANRGVSGTTRVKPNKPTSVPDLYHTVLIANHKKNTIRSQMDHFLSSMFAVIINDIDLLFRYETLDLQSIRISLLFESEIDYTSANPMLAVWPTDATNEHQLDIKAIIDAIVDTIKIVFNRLDAENDRQRHWYHVLDRYLNTEPEVEQQLAPEVEQQLAPQVEPLLAEEQPLFAEVPPPPPPSLASSDSGVDDSESDSQSVDENVGHVLVSAHEWFASVSEAHRWDVCFVNNELESIGSATLLDMNSTSGADSGAHLLALCSRRMDPKAGVVFNVGRRVRRQKAIFYANSRPKDLTVKFVGLVMDTLEGGVPAASNQVSTLTGVVRQLGDRSETAAINEMECVGGDGFGLYYVIPPCDDALHLIATYAPLINMDSLPRDYLVVIVVRGPN